MTIASRHGRSGYGSKRAVADKTVAIACISCASDLARIQRCACTVASKPAPARHRGFTLVEMLVALLVFGLLSVAGVSVLVYAADNRDVISARMERLGEFQRARGLLKADLSQAAMRRVRQGNGAAARDAFVGNRLGNPGPLFAFVRRGWANPDAEPRASLQYVEYRLVDGQLERSARGALDGVAPAAPQVMLTGIEDAAIAYRYRGEWLDGWPGGAETMPQAVRLDLELDGIGRVEQLFLLPGGAQ